MKSTIKFFAPFVLVALVSFAMGFALEAKIISSKLAQIPGFEVLK